jgi:hypothetical protein
MKRFALSLLLCGILFSVVASAQSTWTDPATKLMWAKETNSSDVTWNQAKDYCANLRLAGYSNWRLPTIDELESIYDKTQDVDGRHVKGDIRFNCVIRQGAHCRDGWSAWSNSTGNASGEAWDFDFGFTHGTRNSFRLGYNNDERALCVRHPGE